MEPPVRDYSNVSLDEYIQNNPDALKDIRKRTSKPKKRPSSQQWRLGRNGPRQLKRLRRLGPLRPLVPHHGPREDDGLPKLVLKRYNHLSPSSVFHRLGWNPLHTVARQKLEQARFFMWIRRFNQPRHRPRRLPWGRRRYFPFIPWFNRQQPMWRARNLHGNFRQQNRNGIQPSTRQLSAQQLVKLQRMQTLKRMPFQNQINRQQSRANQLPVNSSVLTSEEAIRNYPIAKDAFSPPFAPDRNIRPPSPVGSIISTLSRSNSNAHPFARSVNQQSSFNPFARTTNQSASQNPFAPTSRATIPNYNVSLNSGFRPTPHTTIPFTQRFSTINDMY